MLLPDLFDDMFDLREPMRGPHGPKERMECDIYEKDGKYVVEASAFGFNKEDIKVEAEDGNSSFYLSSISKQSMVYII